MQTRSISIELQESYTKKYANRIKKMMLLAAFFVPLFYCISIKNDADQSLFMFIVPLLCTGCLMYAIYLISVRGMKMVSANYKLLITDDRIGAKVDLSNIQTKGVLDKFAMIQARNMAAQTNSSISLKSLESVEEKKGGDLLLLEKGGSKMTGRGVFILPKEIEGFDELVFSLRKLV